MNIAAAIIGLILFLCLPYQASLADIYQYVDESGVVHFTNVGVAKGKNSRNIRSERAAAPSHPEPAIQSPANGASKSNGYVKADTVIPDSYLGIINTACDRHGVDPALVHAIVKVESDFNPYALSSKGAMGLMQLMPQTAVDMNVKNSFNPHENIDGGVKYLKYLMDRYEGNLSLALAAYNSGETAVKRWGTVPPFRETQNYVKRILKLYNGTDRTLVPHYTIYIGYGEDGALLLTDNPSNHRDKAFKRKPGKEL